MNNIFDILFLSFCTNIVIFSIFTVTAFNSIQGLIALILTFLSTTFLFFLMELEFLSLLILIVYIGAISVLFLFSVMLFNLKEVVKTKNNNLILKSFFFIFIIFLFLYVLALFSITFQKNLDFLIFLIDYDFLYYENRIIYTFFDQKNEILNFIFITLEEVSNNFTIQNNIFLYTNIVSNINNDLYILGHSIYDFYIIYLILTGLILLIGMYGAISLINNQKPIMQLQHMNRQISTSLSNRNSYIIIAIEYLFKERILKGNFEPLDNIEYGIILGDLENIGSYSTLVLSCAFFTYMFVYNLKVKPIFPHLINYLFLLFVITTLAIFIFCDMKFSSRQWISVIYKGSIFLICLAINIFYMPRVTVATIHDFGYYNYFRPFIISNDRFIPSAKKYALFYQKYSQDNLKEYKPATSIEVKTEDSSEIYYPLYHNPIILGGKASVSYVKAEDINDLNQRYICVTPKKTVIQQILNLLTLLLLLLNQTKEKYIEITMELSLFVQFAESEKYQDLIHKFSMQRFLAFVFDHLYYIEDITKILKKSLISVPNTETTIIDTEDVILIKIFIEISPLVISTMDSIHDTNDFRNDLFTLFSKYNIIKKQYKILAILRFKELTISGLLIIILSSAIEDIHHPRKFEVSVSAVCYKYNDSFEKL